MRHTKFTYWSFFGTMYYALWWSILLNKKQMYMIVCSSNLNYCNTLVYLTFLQIACKGRRDSLSPWSKWRGMYIRNVFECREKYENYQVYNNISDENVFIIVLFCMLISVLITLSLFFSWKIHLSDYFIFYP